MAGLSGGWQDQQLTPSFLDDLDDKLSVMVSAFAINTCSYYFVEFRDEVNEKWMMGFLDYRKNGFPGGKWTSYIEAMIALDKLQVEVLMKCSKAVLRARRIPAGANVAMQYHHDVEPRRIAHKILTVREDVSNEIIEDLGCVLTENAEIVRFATTWATDGREAAEKSRKLTRIRSQGGNTPMRDKHYTQLNVFVTQLAMELIRNDLMSSRDETALETLRVLEAKMETDDVARSILERMLAETEGESFAEGDVSPPHWFFTCAPNPFPIVARPPAISGRAVLQRHRGRCQSQRRQGDERPQSGRKPHGQAGRHRQRNDETPDAAKPVQPPVLQVDQRPRRVPQV